MPAEFIDLLGLPELEIGHSKKVLFTSDHFHTWVHGDYPGTKGPMHKHTADQQFYCVKGECTFHFPDGSSRRLTPGMLVTIPAGQLYQLDNTGDEYMILLGARAEAAAKPRFTGDEQVVTVSDYALRNLDKINAPEEKKARARVRLMSPQEKETPMRTSSSSLLLPLLTFLVLVVYVCARCHAPDKSRDDDRVPE